MRHYLPLLTALFIFGSFTFRGDENLPVGWYIGGDAPKYYTAGMDEQVKHSGSNAAFLQSKRRNPGTGYGTLMQCISAKSYQGKRVRLTSWLKTNKVSDWASIWMRVDGTDPNKSLAFDNMNDRPMKGTSDWQQCVVVLDVPMESTGICFGFLLDGKGKVWADDFQLEIVDNSVPVTNLKTTSPQKPDNPVNLNFDK
jgi:hypothetical protein